MLESESEFLNHICKCVFAQWLSLIQESIRRSSCWYILRHGWLKQEITRPFSNNTAYMKLSSWFHTRSKLSAFHLCLKLEPQVMIHLAIKIGFAHSLVLWLRYLKCLHPIESENKSVSFRTIARVWSVVVRKLTVVRVSPSHSSHSSRQRTFRRRRPSRTLSEAWHGKNRRASNFGGLGKWRWRWTRSTIHCPSIKRWWISGSVLVCLLAHRRLVGF